MRLINLISGHSWSENKSQATAKWNFRLISLRIFSVDLIADLFADLSTNLAALFAYLNRLKSMQIAHLNEPKLKWIQINQTNSRDQNSSDSKRKQSKLSKAN